MYKYLEHEADMGIYAQGKSWQEVFEEAAKAVFNLMYQIDGRQQTADSRKILIKVKADSIESLLVEWINELLAQKDIHSLLFIKFKVDKIKQVGQDYKLSGSVLGINLTQYQGEVKTEVKAATYAGLKCGQENGKYFCQCVVDV